VTDNPSSRSRRAKSGSQKCKAIGATGGRRTLGPEQQAARARTRARMEKGWPIDAGPVDRDRLHER